MKRLGRSIKGRLFFLFFSFTSLLLVAVSLFFYYEVRQIVFDSVDRSLLAKAHVIARVITDGHTIAHEGDTLVHEVHEILGGYSTLRPENYYKVTLNNTPLAASPSIARGGFDPTADMPQPSAGHGDKGFFYTSSVSDGMLVRVFRQDLKAFGNDYSIFVAENLAESVEMIHRFRSILVVVIPSGVLVLCLAGLWITQRSLEPLKDFTARIKTITPKTLSQRLDAGRETLELVGLADSFNELLARLQKVLDSRRRFMADASHELKTPVSVIMVQCDVILQKKRPVEEYVEAVTTIRSVTGSIDRLVKDLLSLTRLDSGMISRSDFAVFALDECLHKAVMMMKPLAGKKGIRIVTTVENGIFVTGNKDSLIETFLNILENGIKYNRENGLLEVSAAGSNGKAVISVRDTGVGIREEDRERIFDRFYRAGDSRSTEGTGLGLSIAREILRAHGGEISMESEWGKGSTCTVVLPMNVP